MADLAPRPWGIPVVSSTTERDELFPSPATNQRVQNLETGRYERWTGVAWVADSVPSIGNVLTQGAVGDGVADDTAALTATINAVIAAGGGEVVLPAGAYKTTSNIVADVTGLTPKGLVIRGVPYATTLKPSSAVTVCLTIAGDLNNDGAINRVVVSGLDLDGTNTNAATGLLVDDNATNLSGYNLIRDVQILHFQGAGAKGLYIKNAVNCHYQNVYVGRNDTNVYSSGDTVQGLPTLQTFNSCQFREATTKGVNIVSGYQIAFNDCLFEANGEEGLYVVPTDAAQNCLGIRLNGGWVEDNYNSAGHVQIRADASLGGGTVSVQIRGTKFNAAHQSIYFKNVVDMVLDDISPINQAGDVTIDTGCVGFVTNWHHNNAPIATVLVCNSLATVGMLEAKAWDKLAWDANGDLTPLSTFDIGLGTSSLRYDGVFCRRVVPYYAQPTYGVSIAIDASQGFLHEIIVTDGTGFAINTPTNPVVGQPIAIKIKNTSGGDVGAVNWSGSFKLAAWTSPATGFNRTITFWYDGTAWGEIGRVAADVPN